MIQRLDDKLMGSLYDALQRTDTFVIEFVRHWKERYYEKRYGHIPKTVDEVIEQAKRNGVRRLDITVNGEIDYVHLDVHIWLGLERYVGGRRYDDLIVYKQEKRLLNDPNLHAKLDKMQSEAFRYQIELATQLLQNGLNFRMKGFKDKKNVWNIDDAKAKLESMGK